MIGAYQMRPKHVKFFIEILPFIVASNLWLRASGELILVCLSGEYDGCMMGNFGAQRDIHGTEGIYCVVRFNI